MAYYIGGTMVNVVDTLFHLTIPQNPSEVATAIHSALWISKQA